MKQVRERHILYVSSYPWNLKIKQNSEHNKVETNSQIKRTNQGLIRGRRKAEGSDYPLTAEGLGSISALGTKIQQAMGCCQKQAKVATN